MACRYVKDEGTDSGVEFSLVYYSGGAVTPMSSVYMIRIWPDDSKMFTGGYIATNKRTRGIRPVITLFDNIKTNEGDGSETNPFKLVEQ